MATETSQTRDLREHFELVVALAVRREKLVVNLFAQHGVALGLVGRKIDLVLELGERG